MIFQMILMTLALGSRVSAYPTAHSAVLLKNGQDTITLNHIFATLDLGDPCQADERACIGGSLAQCIEGRFVPELCPGMTSCSALPLINSAGTMVACTIPAIFDARMAVTGAVDASKSSWEYFAADAAMVAIHYDDYIGGGATDLQTSFGMLVYFCFGWQ
ncbi:hypothetical protein B0H11DRAFT_1985126 [Mycena galericulata]|nr:hypothetical protein B0H11DRAFT_1985126 [Mycena galericulata]